MFIVLLLLLLLLLPVPPTEAKWMPPAVAVSSHGCPPERCGTFGSIPYPFRLTNNSDCGELLSDVFHLSCHNSTSLFLIIGSYRYQVLHFFPDSGGVLVDFPNDTIRYSSSCRKYYDLRSFPFPANHYFGISMDNILGLYGCGDSSLCRTDCGGCRDANTTTTFMSSGCCYPLSDDGGGVWSVGDGFSVFQQFGCKGFSCWVGSGSNNGDDVKRGIKLEWAIPIDMITGVCDSNARTLNASSVIFGMRCRCLDGFVGDGFARGIGCLKSCLKDGEEVYGDDCYVKRHGRSKLMLVGGSLALGLSIVTLAALFCLLKRQTKQGTVDADQARSQTSVWFHKRPRTRLFTHSELEDATKGFGDDQKLVSFGDGGTLYAGVLSDGLEVAVHKVECPTERDLIRVLSRVKILSEVSHANMAQILGCSIDSGYTPLVVFEYPGNGTLEQHLSQMGNDQKTSLEWHNRLSIAAEVSSVLAFLQCEIFPPVLHHCLQSGCIMLDSNLSVKLVGFELLGDGGDGCGSDGPFSTKNDVYGLGVLLLEIIAGGRSVDLATVALRKIRNGKLEEVVDPTLYYHEQPGYRKEQIEVVADVATRCLLFAGDGRLGINDVTKELLHVTKESIDHVGSRRGPAGLEETFSNSSLLQMISLSPDSIYVP
ncbi:probably inactive receptor-like protein kinase At2g46850 [Cynara cardunculus var. scolymus]|uniref:Concanavalin A-like lectin/glucanase, subgroup n=1 Tax=Cynara cardunculus var. scolymus TaxID=59895 RepID=A0A103XUQ1_CYNCS|nr:probably inactive receptor-like protein kinase At2g46850 [Cynara cardunculus var. scolymus]KVH97263.1 Concanavalin A-like lectin/glucanase, subgroup [Cynara cardunculus var. scolymus]